MTETPPAGFLAGVIEGFYGEPWTGANRAELFDWMAAGGLNAYLYAPKDDLKHRVLWRERYSTDEAEALRALVQGCRERGLRFIHAMGPGLDLRYSEAGEVERLRQRFEQMLGLGCEDFAVLFDDIPDHLEEADRRRWGSFASAQCHAANTVFAALRRQLPAGRGRFFFCPTPYCGRMAHRQLGGAGYLETVGRELDPAIDVFWTGPEIISAAIPLEEIASVSQQLRRPPVLWDNQHANDYDRRRFHGGPCAGRALELRGAVRGWLTNPNCEFPLNFVPLRTFARFLQAGGSWDPRQAYLEAVQAWAPQFDTVRQPITVDDLVLFTDCFYLPQEEGAEAETLYREARRLISPGGLGGAPDPGDDRRARFQERAARLRDTCARMAELRDRSLFHALSRFAWDLREELDLVLTYLRTRGDAPAAAASGNAGWSDFHLPGTYRGGLVSRLQRLLIQQPDGTFTPAPLSDPMALADANANAEAGAPAATRVAAGIGAGLTPTSHE